MSEASETLLSKSLRLEHEHHLIARRVLDDVLLNYRADDRVKASALCLIEWLSMPAESIAAKQTEKAGCASTDGAER